MNNFVYITPDKYFKLKHSSDKRTLQAFKDLAKSRSKKCDVCGVEDAWKLVGTGMCFSCTTGESDASDDYEIREDKG